MTLHLSQSTAAMCPTLPERFVTAAGEAARAALGAFQATWRDQVAHVDQGSAYKLMADIDEHTLKDIGAPNWLIAEAVERKDAHHRRLLELYRS